MHLLILVAIAYLLGSLSSAVIFSKLLQLPDPREEGSGNAGATNVLRISGKRVAMAVLLADVVKGLLPVLIGRMMGFGNFSLALLVLAAVVGHIYPLFFMFKGGKGVATALGGLLGLSPLLAFALIPIWVGIAFVTRYASLASLVTTATGLVLYMWYGSQDFVLPLGVVTLLIFWRHAENIYRLMDGNESKIEL